MKAEIIWREDHWEINFYNNLGELVDCYYVTDLVMGGV